MREFTRKSTHKHNITDTHKHTVFQIVSLKKNGNGFCITADGVFVVQVKVLAGLQWNSKQNSQEEEALEKGQRWGSRDQRAKAAKKKKSIFNRAAVYTSSHLKWKSLYGAETSALIMLNFTMMRGGERPW